MLDAVFSPEFLIQCLILTVIWLLIAWKVYPYHVLERIRWFFSDPDEVRKASKVGQDILIERLLDPETGLIRAIGTHIKNVFWGCKGSIAQKGDRAAKLDLEPADLIMQGPSFAERMMLQKAAQMAQSEDTFTSMLGQGGIYLYQKQLAEKQQAATPAPVTGEVTEAVTSASGPIGDVHNGNPQEMPQMRTEIP